MIRRYAIIFLLFTLISFSTYSAFVTGAESSISRQKSKIELLTVMKTSPTLEKRLPKWGVKKTLIMYQKALDAEDTGRWSSREKTKKWIEDNVDSDYDGYLTLDWEHKGGRVLRNGPKDPKFQDTLNEFIRALQFVKKARPKAKVGYYGIPYKEYWKQDETWRNNTRALKPLFDASDVLFPSVYDFYGIKPDRDHQRFSNIVRISLEMAQGKPVLLYTHHRYHNSTEKWGFQLIPEREYIDHISTLLKVEYHGQRPAGVIAWGADTYYHRAGWKKNKKTGKYKRNDAKWQRVRQVYGQELRNQPQFETYRDKTLHPNVYRNLLKVVNEASDS